MPVVGSACARCDRISWVTGLGGVAGLVGSGQMRSGVRSQGSGRIGLVRCDRAGLAGSGRVRVRSDGENALKQIA